MEVIKKHSIQILLSSIIVSTILSIYTPWIPIIAILVVGITAGVFVFCSFVEDSEQGSTIFLLSILGLLGIFVAFYFFTPLQNFNEIMNSDKLNPATLVLLVGIGSFIVGSATYYFTQVRFRCYILVLLIFIPCTLYAKQFKPVPVIYVALIIVLYFANLIDCKRQEVGEFVEPTMEKIYHRGMLAFVLIVFAVIMIMPKASRTPFDYFKGQLFSENGNNLGSFSNVSGTTNVNKVDQVVLHLKSEEALYLKSQVFAEYDGQRWLASKLAEFSQGEGNWTKDFENANILSLVEAIKILEQEGENILAKIDNLFLENLIQAKKWPILTSENKKVQITHVNFPSRILSHPDQTFLVEGINPSFLLYRTALGEIFPDNQKRFSPTENYVLTYFSNTPEDAEAMIELFSSLTVKEYAEALMDVYTHLPLETTPRAVHDGLDTLYQEADKALLFDKITQYEIPVSLKNRAREITQNASTDYAKAKAIEAYFHEQSNKYTYSLSYTPPPEYKDNIEYFVTTSKTGACGNYATAMTLMAKSVGLVVRYVEGFYAAAPDVDGTVSVSTKNAHAYVEIFLPGMGWTVFEPTVSYTDEAEVPVTNPFFQLANHEIMTLTLSLVFLGCLLFFLIKKMVFPPVAEFIFRGKIQTIQGNKAIAMMYNKMILLTGKRCKQSVDYFTPVMLAEFMQENYGFSLQSFVSLYEKAAFDQGIIATPDRKKAYQVYIGFAKTIKKRTRKALIMPVAPVFKPS